MKSNLENIKNIFAQMSNDNWNTNENLNWGYFFFDKDKLKLKKLYELLKQEDFHLNGLNETELGGWKLSVNKNETLTPKSLHKRNLKFNELTDSLSIELYDGWDVEKTI